jgi:hypothetical protein
MKGATDNKNKNKRDRKVYGTYVTQEGRTQVIIKRGKCSYWALPSLDLISTFGWF